MNPKNKTNYKQVGLESQEVETEMSMMDDDSKGVHKPTVTKVEDGSVLKVSFTPSITKTPTIQLSPMKVEEGTEKLGGREPNIHELALIRLAKQFCKDYVAPCCLLTIWLVLFGLSQIAWEKSLLGCEYDIVVCIKWLRGKFVKIILYVVFFTTVHFYIFIHSLYLKNKIVKSIGLFMVVASFGYRYMTSQGFDAEDHSQANLSLCVMVLIALTVIFLWWFFAIKAVKSKDPKFKYGYFVFWTLFWLLIYDFRVRRSCRHLQDSLDPRVKYTNKGDFCRWEHGKICWHFTIDGIFKPLYWGRNDCRTISTDLEEHKKM